MNSDTTTYLLSVYFRLDHTRLVHNSRDKSYTRPFLFENPNAASQASRPSFTHARAFLLGAINGSPFTTAPSSRGSIMEYSANFTSCLCTKRIANVESYRNVCCALRETDYPTAEGSSSAIKRKNSCRSSVREKSKRPRDYVCAVTE